jgi:hypothetical protein
LLSAEPGYGFLVVGREEKGECLKSFVDKSCREKIAALRLVRVTLDFWSEAVREVGKLGAIEDGEIGSQDACNLPLSVQLQERSMRK